MKSFEAALGALSFDPAIARMFAGADRSEVDRLAGWIAEADPYRERGHLRRALEIVSASPDLASRHVVHKLWCAWRQAAWVNDLAEPLEARAVGAEWLAETAGHPTVLLAPMTLAAPDALHAIASLKPADRTCIAFGEDMEGAEGTQPEQRPDVATGAAVEAVPKIRSVLDEDGIYCTYADFVYDGRGAQPFDLFGVPRPISSGFLSLAARDGAMLLPLVALHRDGAIEVEMAEPLQISLEEDLAEDRAAARRLVAPVVANALESLIRRAPEQWLLLPTLTFESPEMAQPTFSAGSPSS